MNLTEEGVSFIGRVNEIQVVEADLFASNGVVHKVNSVLLPPALYMNLVEVAVTYEFFSTLVELVVAAGLDETLATGGEFTVLAPTNDAFADLPSDLAEAVVSDVEIFKSILLFHVLPGVIPSQLLEDGQVIETALTETSVVVAVSSDVVTFNGVSVTQANLVASNGILHVMSGVLIPPSDPESPVLPPTPPPSTAVITPPFVGTSIVDIAQADNTLATLVAAVIAAGLVDALSAAGPFTLLAPENTAFAELGSSLVEQYLQPQYVVHLRTLLQLHVIPLNLLSTGFTDGMFYDTLTDDLLLAAIDDNGVTFTGEIPDNSALVTTADLVAGNGVVHKVDQVLVPLALTLNMVDVASMTGLSALSELVVKAGLEERLGDPNSSLTLLAPRDEAFAALPTEVVNALEQDLFLLRNYLLYHVLTDLYPSELLVDGTEAGTAFGDFTVRIGVDSSAGYTMNDTPVVQADVVAGNGLVHVIENVLVV